MSVPWDVDVINLSCPIGHGATIALSVEDPSNGPDEERRTAPSGVGGLFGSATRRGFPAPHVTAPAARRRGSGLDHTFRPLRPCRFGSVWTRTSKPFAPAHRRFTAERLVQAAHEDALPVFLALLAVQGHHNGGLTEQLQAQGLVEGGARDVQNGVPLGLQSLEGIEGVPAAAYRIGNLRRPGSIPPPCGATSANPVSARLPARGSQSRNVRSAPAPRSSCTCHPCGHPSFHVHMHRSRSRRRLSLLLGRPLVDRPPAVGSGGTVGPQPWPTPLRRMAALRWAEADV